jgi:hypothetical protein
MGIYGFAPNGLAWWRIRSNREGEVMSIDWDVGTVADVPRSELRAKLAEHHAEHPQRAMLADLALRQVELGLADLAKMGHRMKLVFDSGSEPVQFPKMIYKRGVEPVVVLDQHDLDSHLSDGWAEMPVPV